MRSFYSYEHAKAAGQSPEDYITNFCKYWMMKSYEEVNGRKPTRKSRIMCSTKIDGSKVPVEKVEETVEYSGGKGGSLMGVSWT